MKDQIRAEFEQEFPLPNGVTFDGDHYVADPEVMGSFSNATIWSHMYRGWKRRQETISVKLPRSGYWGGYDQPSFMEAEEVEDALKDAGIRYVD